MSYEHDPARRSWPAPEAPPPTAIPEAPVLPGAGEAKPRQGRRRLIITVALVAVAAIGAVVLTRDDGPSRLERAAEAGDSAHIELGDDGHTLIIDSAGSDGASGGASLDDIVAVLAALDTPESVIAQMDSTRALDGAREAEWDGLTATWTYHPDDGLDIIITD